MGVPVALPFNLINGSTADASQVMANYGAITNALANQVAESGSNSSITALTGLVSSIPISAGGTTVFLGVVSTGSANVQTVGSTNPIGFSLSFNETIIFTAGFTNTGPMTLSVGATVAKNVYKRSFAGPVALTGGEITAGNLVIATYDGTQYEIVNDLPAFGSVTGLSLSGTTADLGTVPSHFAQISGSGTINSFGSTASLNFPIYIVRFAGVFTLVNSSSLILPGNFNIVTASSDGAIAYYGGGGVWQILSYTRAATLPLTAFTAPIVSVVTATGAGTYTTPVNSIGALPLYLRVGMCGPGGGGGSTNNSGSNGSAATTFAANGGTNWSAGNGSGGPAGGVTGAGGAPGANSTGSIGTVIRNFAGQRGGPPIANASAAVSGFGGQGGNTPVFGGGGVSQSNAAGLAAIPNTGGGGAGGAATNGNGGGGGGSGGLLEFLVPTPAATQSFFIGSGGAGGTLGNVGGAGSDGRIEITAYWQ